MSIQEIIVKVSQVLADVNGASFISMDTETVPKLTGGKANQMQGRVKKVNSGASIMVFQNKHGSAYDAMVKRRLAKEGKNPESFQLSPRTWGTRIPGTPLIEHKGELYIEVIFLKGGKSSYTLDGKPIAASEVQGLPKANDSDDNQGGLDDKVIIRTFKLSNITWLKIGKREFNPNK